MMSGEQRNLEESLKPFFGWSNGSVQFFNSTYFHSRYDSGVNTESFPNVLFGTPTEYIMFAKNYNGLTEEKPNDIHHQYIDFIVKTALFHREIDRSTTMGLGMIEFRALFDEAIAMVIDQSVIDVMRDTGNTNMLLNHGVNLPGLDAITDVSFADLGLDADSSFFDFIVGYLFMMGKEINNKAVVSNVELLRNSELITDGDLVNRNDYQFQSVEDYIIALAGCKYPVVLNEFRGNYCSASLYNSYSKSKSGKKSTAGDILSALADKIEDVYNTANNIRRDLSTIISNVFTECLLKLAEELFVTVDITEVFKMFDEHYATRGNKPLIKNYFQNALADLHKKNAENTLKQCLSDGTFAEVKKKMNDGSSDKFVTIYNNEWSTRVVENVFMVWDKLSPNARLFYGQHLHVFAQQKSRIAKTPMNVNELDYVDLMPNGNYMNQMYHNRDNIRLNLMKERGIGEVLFGQTLPWLPVDSDKVGVAWYTASDGHTLKSFKPEKDSLRRLYHDVYKNGEFKIKNTKYNLDLPKTYHDLVKVYENKDFDVNDMHIIYNTIRQKTAEEITKEAAPVEFADLFEDLATNDIYKRDERGLYKLINGVKVHVGENPPIDNCVGSFLNNSGDNAKCVKIVRKCLIDGDKDGLAKCLDELRDTNLFDVAHKELEGMHPEIAIRILKTFGVGGKNVGGIHVVELLHEWIERVVSRLKPDVRDAIMNNTQLKDYISGVISFVNLHPVIMNPHLADSGEPIKVPDEIHPEDVRMNKTEFYYRPHPSSKEGKLFAGTGLCAYSAHMSALPPVLTGISTVDPYTNTLRGQVMGGIGFAQYGGAPLINSSSRSSIGNSGKMFEEKLERRHAAGEMSGEILEGLLGSVVEDLKKAGTPLRNADSLALMKGINQIKYNEGKLIELYSMLRSLVDLSEFFKASCFETIVAPKEISINQIRTRKQTIEFLKDSICKMEDCIGKNVSSQNASCNDMIRHFGTIFEAAGKQ